MGLFWGGRFFFPPRGGVAPLVSKNTLRGVFFNLGPPGAPYETPSRPKKPPREGLGVGVFPGSKVEAFQGRGLLLAGEFLGPKFGARGGKGFLKFFLGGEGRFS